MTRRNIFLGAVAAFFAVFLLDLLFGFTQERQLYCIFAKGGDFLADSLNHFRYAWNGDPYFDDSVSALCDHVFPPLAYLIYLPAKFVGGAVPTLAQLQRNVPLCAGILVVSAILALAFVVALKNFVSSRSWFVPCLFLFSGPLIYSFERGNIIWLSLIGSALFFAFHDSPLKSRRLIAAVALSVAAGIKVYPAFFILLWLPRREWKLMALTIAMTAFLGFAPLLAFPHSILETSLQLLANVKAQETTYLDMSFFHTVSPYAYLRYLTLRILHLPPVAVTLLCSLCYVWAAVCAFVALKTRIVWVRLFMIVTALFFVQNLAMYYCVLYFYPAVAAFLGDDSRKTSRLEMAFAIGFAILLTPLQFYTPSIDFATLTKLLGHPSPIDKLVFSLSPFIATMLISLGSLALAVRHFAIRPTAR